MAETLKTPLTEMLGLKYPIMLAGMSSVSGHSLVAAVSNAGGIGTLGGVRYTPQALRKEIRAAKELMKPGTPFGVDLLLPQVGGSARKTNSDYTDGNLPELIDVVIEEKATLFVSAVGVPPKWAVDKLHSAGIVCMNMVGAAHHVPKALEVGMDVICAQGTEAGGHTGDVTTMVLIPQCVDACKGKKNFFGHEVPVVAAGGIYDGRGLGASLCLGAVGVWLGTRFIACEESGAGPVHRKRVLEANSKDTTRTEIFTGRPCRALHTPYVKAWESDSEKLKGMLANGRIPWQTDIGEGKQVVSEFFPNLMGQVAGSIKEIKTADAIVQEIMGDAMASLRFSTQLISKM
eukprot:TRINITY_DN11085_c0_g1_i2.p1 TRINITY_DN11085_c0_g1~~TRINITY_DN11085_c0_g1_i2.p1  ORF type:complete len:376 (+),score=63.49 TRINITY_DN11085_c0_g1_i2:92-1129(+)